MSGLYRQRLDRFKSYLTEQQIDVAMVTSPTNIFYLTGFLSDPHERFMALLMDVRNDSVLLFVPALDWDAAKEASDVRLIIPVEDSEEPYEKLADEIGSPPASFGVEKKAMSLFQYEALVERIGQVRYPDIENFIVTERLKKNSEDIRGVQRAIDITEEVLNRGIERFTPRMTELELTAELECQMRALGADGPSFATSVLAGSHAALPHGIPGTQKISTGDFLLIDMGVYVNGYCSDMTRTFLIGKGTEEQVKIYQTVLEANQKAIDMVKVGEPISTVDKAARNHIKDHGYGEYFNNRVGHGMGLEVHEAPSIHEENEMAIAPGLLFTIEPGIYIPEVGGVRIEDDVYVNENGGVEVLTHFPKKLQYIG